jgi:hypothetical protein
VRTPRVCPVRAASAWWRFWTSGCAAAESRHATARRTCRARGHHDIAKDETAAAAYDFFYSVIFLRGLLTFCLPLGGSRSSDFTCFEVTCSQGIYTVAYSSKELYDSLLFQHTNTTYSRLGQSKTCRCSAQSDATALAKAN